MEPDRRPDATHLFEALEAALVEGTPTLSLQSGRIWIDGETAFDARTVIARLSSAKQVPGDSSRDEPTPTAGDAQRKSEWRCSPIAEEHELKCWDPHFQNVLDGRKPFEVRRYDRCFRVGDILWLREWRPNTERYSGRECRVGVTHVLMGGQFGIEDGYCVMGITPPLSSADAEPSAAGGA